MTDITYKITPNLRKNINDTEKISLASNGCER